MGNLVPSLKPSVATQNFHANVSIPKKIRLAVLVDEFSRQVGGINSVSRKKQVDVQNLVTACTTSLSQPPTTNNTTPFGGFHFNPGAAAVEMNCKNVDHAMKAVETSNLIDFCHNHDPPISKRLVEKSGRMVCTLCHTSEIYTNTGIQAFPYGTDVELSSLTYNNRDTNIRTWINSILSMNKHKVDDACKNKKEKEIKLKTTQVWNASSNWCFTRDIVWKA